MTINIPAIFANVLIKKYNRDKTAIKKGIALINDIILTQKGMKYELSGNESTITDLCNNEQSYMKTMIANLNK